MDAATLETEIQTDPRVLGYAALLAAGNDAGVAALLNAIVGPGAATIAPAAIDRNTFLKITLAAAIRIATGVGTDGAALAAGAAAKWGAVLTQARAADPGSQIDLTLLPSLGDPSADRVMVPISRPMAADLNPVRRQQFVFRVKLQTRASCTQRKFHRRA